MNIAGQKIKHLYRMSNDSCINIPTFLLFKYFLILAEKVPNKKKKKTTREKTLRKSFAK